MFRGRYFLGDEIPLSVLCTNSAGVPTFPDAAPQLEIYTAAGKLPGGWLPGGLGGNGSGVPVLDRYGTTGLFAVRVFLSLLFSTGLYQATYRWTVGGFQGCEQDTFEILPGGDGKGHVIALDFYPRPNADWLIQQLDSGRVLAGRNPRL